MELAVRDDLLEVVREELATNTNSPYGVVDSATMDKGYNMCEAESAVNDEAARLLGVLKTVFVARQVSRSRSEDSLESESGMG